MKTLILVLSFDGLADVTNAQKATWGKKVRDDVDVIYYWGGGGRSTDTDWRFDVKEGLYNIGRKTIKAFQKALDYDYDFIYRVNTSCYINQDNVVKFLEDKSTGLYAGNYGLGVDGIYFLLGSNYFISRDIAELIVSNKSLWNHKLIDDVAIADLLWRFGVKHTDSKISGVEKNDRYNIWTKYKGDCTSLITDSLSDGIDILREQHFIRVNMAPNRHIDAELLNEIHRII